MNTRTQSRFQIWASSPVIIFRVALISTYLLYIYSGIIAVIAGIPVFDLTAPAGYATIWGICLCLASIVCAVGAVDDRWQVWERWASLVLSSLMVAYTGALNLLSYAEGDLTRMFVGGVAAIALVLPICRFVYLAAQTGKRRKK